ncbi:MAG: nitroreductase family protein [Bdellovibrionales bacterium]
MKDLEKHLTTRRSVSIKNLSEPAPSKDDLKKILTIGARVPDHGKMAPWYFITFQGNAREDIKPLLRKAYELENPEATEAKLDLESERFMRAPLIIGVISRIRMGKHPMWEQTLSAGAVCMNICHAAHALGYGANWLTEWYSFNDHFKKELGLDERDNVAGFIYIGTPTCANEERERPYLSKIVNNWSPDIKLEKGDSTYDKPQFGFPKKGVEFPD